MLETVSGIGLHECLANFISRYSFLIVHGNQSQIRKAFFCHKTDLAYILILLIKEKDRSASALDISNVQPTTSRKWMLGKESMSHAPKASRRVLGISLFCSEFPLTFMFIHRFRVLEVFLPFKHIIRRV